MIRKSGHRFSEKNMLNETTRYMISKAGSARLA
jgi:hypothetical protein